MRRRRLSNKEAADILKEMAARYEIAGIPWKPAAYERAALAVESLEEPLAALYEGGGEKALEDISGVGRGIAGHLAALLRGKRFKEYERLQKKLPVDVVGLMAVEGVGPRTVKLLWEKLGVRTLDGLARAAREGKLARIPRLGKKTEEKILTGIAFLKSSGGRQLLGEALSLARSFEERIGAFPEVSRAVAAGSIRRRAETVGDLDILAISRKPEATMRKLLRFPEIAHTYGAGKTKANVRLARGIDMDIRIVPKRAWGAALNYFTGSKPHNIALRKIALTKGLTLNEYGLSRGGRFVGGRTEEELYKKLGFSYIPPELREMTGEIGAARRGALPRLVGYDALKGDVQAHTNASDGASSIEEMAKAAREAGLEYLAITDHTKGLAVTGGMDAGGFAKQGREIDAINAKLAARGEGFTLLKGAEVNLKKDGTPDLPDAALRRFDLVGAAVHSHFVLSRAEQTKRLIAACEHPHIDIIFHPAGRLIGKRPGIEVDFEEVLRAAKRTGTILEINASPERLDLAAEHIRLCVKSGVKLAVGSDAHSPAGFRFLELGLAQARRGFAEKRHVVNTLPLQKFRAKLKRARDVR